MVLGNPAYRRFAFVAEVCVWEVPMFCLGHRYWADQLKCWSLISWFVLCICSPCLMELLKLPGISGFGDEVLLVNAMRFMVAVEQENNM